MTNERKVEIINEAKRRLSLWLENSTFEEMTFYYSQIRFHMALGLIGYPFEKPEWMKDKGFDKFISKVKDMPIVKTLSPYFYQDFIESIYTNEKFYLNSLVELKKEAPQKMPKPKPAVEEKSKKAKTNPVATLKADQSKTPTEHVLPKRVIHDPEVGKMPDHDTDETIDPNYMNAEEQAYFRQRLLDWKIELMQEVDSTVDHLKTEDITGVADPIDRASLETDFSLELRTRDRERKLIQKIDLSLDQIKHGEYGFCEDCGVAIGRKRLEARPTAVKCIDCKTFSEIKEKQGN